MLTPVSARVGKSRLNKEAGVGSYRWIGATALALCYLLVAWQTAVRVRDAGIETLAENGRRQLILYVTHLQGQLAKYEYLPRLISIDGRMVELLKGSPDPARVAAGNRLLEEINRIAGAADTYLMNPEGLTVAASNWAS